MICLITNSDDFGMNQSITDAIVETHLNGIMTSTTIMVNMPGSEYAVKKAKEIDTLGIGIHFNLTEGIPLTEVSKIPDLVTKEGVFKNNKVQRKNLLYGRAKLNQVELELQNQLERLLDYGIIPSHFDSHHHITGLPLAFHASMVVAKKHKLNKARITNTRYRYSNNFRGGISLKLKNLIKDYPKSTIHDRNKALLRKNGFDTPDIKLLPNRILPHLGDPIDQFIQALSILKNGVTEISFHPGRIDSNPDDKEGMRLARVRDLAVATSDAVKQFILDNNIKLISYKEL